MTDAPHQDDERTRDLAWPLPPPPAPEPAGPDFSAPPPGLPEPDREPPTAERVAPSAFDKPTAALDGRRSRDRNPTLTFSSPEMVHRPVGPIQVGRSPRRWPWVVLSVVPVLVIVVTGIWLFLLLRAA